MQDEPINNKARARTDPKTHIKTHIKTHTTTRPGKSPKPEATRDPKLNDADKTPGSGMISDGRGDAPTG